MKRGSGRGGMQNMSSNDPELKKKQDTLNALIGQNTVSLNGALVNHNSNKIVTKDDNAAKTHPRPLYDKGPNWEWEKYWAYFRSREEVT